MKNKLIKMVGAIAAVVAVSATVQATPITGSISFNGDETAYSAANGGGTVDGDLSAAQSIVFNTTVVSTLPIPNGSFAGLGGSSVTMAPFLNINPAALPAGAIWTVGGFSLTLTSLQTLLASTTSLTLYGTGTFSDATPADSTSGSWTATFTSSGPADNGVTFSWNSSATTTPDGGTTVMLLGSALAGLGLLKRKLLS